METIFSQNPSRDIVEDYIRGIRGTQKCIHGMTPREDTILRYASEETKQNLKDGNHDWESITHHDDNADLLNLITKIPDQTSEEEKQNLSQLIIKRIVKSFIMYYASEFDEKVEEISNDCSQFGSTEYVEA